MADHDLWCLAWYAGDEDAVGATRAALKSRAKWALRAAISVGFLDGDPEMHEMVKAIANEWIKPGLARLTFEFRADPREADVRISFARPGNWSLIGTTCRQETNPAVPTMNLGGVGPTTTADQARRPVLHEFGHALGLIHEHQSPDHPIQWNKPAVFEELTNPPYNWSVERIDRNLFAPQDANETNFTAFDPDSIMVYPIPTRWTTDGFSVDFNGGLSPTDREFIAKLYP